jgi:hypothetical protein
LTVFFSAEVQHSAPLVQPAAREAIRRKATASCVSGERSGAAVQLWGACPAPGGASQCVRACTPSYPQTRSPPPCVQSSSHQDSGVPAIVELYDEFQGLGYGSVANRALASTAWGEPTMRTRQLILAGHPPGPSLLTDDAVHILLGMVSAPSSMASAGSAPGTSSPSESVSQPCFRTSAAGPGLHPDRACREWMRATATATL